MTGDFTKTAPRSMEEIVPIESRRRKEEVGSPPPRKLAWDRVESGEKIQRMTRGEIGVISLTDEGAQTEARHDQRHC